MRNKLSNRANNDPMYADIRYELNEILKRRILEAGENEPKILSYYKEQQNGE